MGVIRPRRIQHVVGYMYMGYKRVVYGRIYIYIYVYLYIYIYMFTSVTTLTWVILWCMYIVLSEFWDIKLQGCQVAASFCCVGRVVYGRIYVYKCVGTSTSVMFEHLNLPLLCGTRCVWPYICLYMCGYVHIGLCMYVLVEFGDIKMQSCQVALDGSESPLTFTRAHGNIQGSLDGYDKMSVVVHRFFNLHPNSRASAWLPRNLECSQENVGKINLHQG